MATRWQLAVVALCTFLATPSAHADIYRWDTEEMIPGQEGIEPGAGIYLGGWITSVRNQRTGGSLGALNLTLSN